MEDDVHDVADDGTGCRQGAGALAVEHDVADAVAADAEDGVFMPFSMAKTSLGL